MRKISVNLLTNAVLLLSGVMLVIFHGQPDLLDWVARIVGLMFALPSVAFLVLTATRHSSGNGYLGVLPAVGGLCFGIVLLAKPHPFTPMLGVCMGALLIVLGLFHVIYLFLSRRDLEIRGGYYFIPLLITVCGVLVLFVDPIRLSRQAVVLTTGICLLLFNVTSFQEYRAERRARRAAPTLPLIGDDEPAGDDDTGRACNASPDDERELHVEL